MTANALYGLLASALLIGAACTFLPGGRRQPLALGLAGLALTPILAGESPAAWLHGALGTPSLTLVQLACCRLAGPAYPSCLRRPAAWIVLATAGLFYPLALGLGPFDPYRLGYQPLAVLAILAPLAGWLAWRRQNGWLIVLGFDLFGYACGLFGNLWDALLDPLLVLTAIITLASHRLGRHKASTPARLLFTNRNRSGGNAG